MSVLELAEGALRLCSCGCNRRVHRTTEWRHKKRVQPESPPPPKRRRIAHFQAESPVITPDKQNRARTDNIPSSSHSRVDTSDRQLHAPSFDEFNPSLPSLDSPPAHPHTRKHRTADQSDDEDSEDVVEGDAVEGLEAANYVDHESDDFRNE